MINLTPTISLVEAMWTTVALWGLIVAFLAHQQFLRDRAVRRANKENGSLMIVVNGNIRGQRVHIVIKTLAVGMGIISMSRPPVPGSHLLSDVFGLLLTGILALLVWNNNQDRIERSRLLGYLQGQHHPVDISAQVDQVNTQVQAVDDKVDLLNVKADHLTDKVDAIVPPVT